MALHSIKGFVHDTHRYGRALHRLHHVAAPRHRSKHASQTMGWNEPVFTLPGPDLLELGDHFFAWLDRQLAQLIGRLKRC